MAPGRVCASSAACYFAEPGAGGAATAERAAATFLWRRGALRSALDGLGLKIRELGQLDSRLVWLCEVGEITSECTAFVPVSTAAKKPPT